MSHTLFVITFDENDSSNDNTNNLIYTLFLGDSVQAGVTSTQMYTHFSLLRLVEDIFGLGNLGRQDSWATPINDVFK